MDDIYLSILIDISSKLAAERRFQGSREHYFHSYGHYLFVLKQDDNCWKISSITQTLLINDGNPKLHGAFK